MSVLSSKLHVVILGQSNASNLRNAGTDGISGQEYLRRAVDAEQLFSQVSISNYAVGSTAVDSDRLTNPVTPNLGWWFLDSGTPGPTLVNAIAGIRADITRYGLDLTKDHISLVWSQGESDASGIRQNNTTIERYTAATKAVFDYVRSQIAAEIPVFMIETGNYDQAGGIAIGRSQTFINASNAAHAQIQQAQRAIDASLDYVHLAAAYSGTAMADALHFTESTYDAIGKQVGDYIANTYERQLNTNETVVGGGGGETVVGGGGGETVVGGGGGETVVGGGGGETVVGGGGGETVVGGGGGETVVGGGGGETVVGGGGGETVVGGGGGETVVGGGGGETVVGGGGGETVVGGGGGETVVGGGGGETVVGGGGGETVVGGGGGETVVGGGGGETVVGGGSPVNLFGTHGNDSVTGTAISEIIVGGLGKDTLTGGGGEDIFRYTSRLESLLGSDDRIMDFDVSKDTIDLTGLGYYGIVGSAPSEGQLRVSYSSTTDRTYVRDDFSDFEFHLIGNHRTTLTKENFIFDQEPGALIVGTNGAEKLKGRDGNDTIDGGLGKDTLTGGLGEDVFRFSHVTHSPRSQADRISDFNIGEDKIDISQTHFTSLNNTTLRTVDGELRITYNVSSNITYVRSDQVSFEIGLSGGDYRNSLTSDSFIFGTPEDILLVGTASADKLIGKNGNDTIDGGLGKDTLTGGAGEDVFRFSHVTHSPKGTPDRIKDFVVGQDTLDLSALNFQNLTSAASTSTGELRMTYSVSANVTYVRSDQLSFEIGLEGADYRNILTESDFLF
jgi:Ca2+-binding RTX toxin-like protein